MPRGRLTDAHRSRVSSSHQWGVELGWEAEVPAGTSYSGGPLPGRCWGQREGTGHWACRASMGGGHGTQNVKAGLSAQDGGRVHTGLRPEFTGTAEPLLGPRVLPPPVRLESLGGLSQLCVKAES